MQSSEQLAEAERILAEVRTCLSERRLSEEIDEPVDEALTADGVLDSSPPLPWTATTLNDFLVRLVQAIHCRGCRLHLRLSRAEALAIAVRLLDGHYATIRSRGYEGALLEAVSGDEGLSDMLATCLAEAVKTEQREMYRRWVLARTIETLDWGMKCAVAAAYFAANRDSLSGTMPSDRPWRFAEYAGELIARHAETESAVLGVHSLLVELLSLRP